METKDMETAKNGNGEDIGVCYVAEYSEDWGFNNPPERGTFRRVHESRDAALKYLNECVEEGKERMADETCEGMGAIHVEAARGVDGIRFYIEGGADFTYWLRKCEFVKG